MSEYISYAPTSINNDESEFKFKVAVLIKEASFERGAILNNYITPVVNTKAAEQADFMAAPLYYGSNGKVSAAQVLDNLESILPDLVMVGVEYIVCADSAHYKKLTNQKPDASLDVAHPCVIKGYESLKVIYNLNYNSLLYNPEQQFKIDIANVTLSTCLSGNGVGRIGIEFDEEVILTDKREILNWLTDYLHEYDELAVDIETFGLKLDEAGLATISFSWSDNSYVSFPVDYVAQEPINGVYGYSKHNKLIRDALLRFFRNYKGNLVYHNASFDVKILIWELFMKDPLDIEGMIEGIETLCRDYDDTKLMAYCCYNSTSRPSRGLKDLTYEYTGDYAQSEIADVTKIELFTLLRYNGTDTCATYWLKNTKLLPILATEQQEDVYYNHFIPAQRVIMQGELHGMPMCDKRINALEADLTAEVDKHLGEAYSMDATKMAEDLLREDEVHKYNTTRKVKRKTVDDFADLAINFNSTTQLRVLLYDVMQLPVIRTTKTGLPACGAKVLKLLKVHVKFKEDEDLLNALISYNEVKKILNDFVPTFKAGILKADGYRYVHGSTNLGGTASGRNSSSNPNLQNMPAKGYWGKRVKECFVAPEDYIFAFSDFNSLEDYISALLSKDPNKLKIYLDGYDGHSIRALRYFPELLPKIDPMDVDAVNAIKKTHETVRDMSKAPTFLMTYLGTAIGLVMNCGFPKAKAEFIYAAFHKEYAHTDAYIEKRLELAAQMGFVTLAFGLRLRCPALKRTPNEKSRYSFRTTAAEKRTVANAMGQSYGMLNDRAVVEFMNKVWDSEYRYDIRFINPIHDASYYIVKDDIGAIQFLNEHLIKAMQWQEDPAIAHDKVKIGAELDICVDSWADPVTIPNGASAETIFKLWDDHVAAKSAKTEEEDDSDIRELFSDDEEEDEAA